MHPPLSPSSACASDQRKGDSLTFFSPAKLNLFFRVLSLRSDGYHEIASLYQCISLGDRLTLAFAERDHLTTDHPDVPLDGSNLLFKALEIFRRKTGRMDPVHFELQKRIPLQAGLGGGSSNAATALWALNALFSTGVTAEELAAWAAAFSSDAPFFFSNGVAYCTGRGEKLESLPHSPPQQLWIAKPQEGLSTPLVYRHCRPELFLQRDPHLSLKEALTSQCRFYNDLETPAFQLLPCLSQLKQDLLELGFSQAVMTGSGTAFFCLGSVTHPHLPGVDFIPAAFHHRREGSWYEFPPLWYNAPRIGTKG